MVPIKTIHGEQKAWSIISELDPADVISRCRASYDQGSGLYTVRSFGMDFYVSPADRLISSNAPDRDILLETYKDFFKLSLLWYLVNARDMPESARLIRPVDVRGGHRFFRGTHVLPLDQVAGEYGRDKAGFMEKGKRLGGEPYPYGDAGVKLYPFPRIPAFMILWIEDEEFPARADLLFDSTCDKHVPTSDIVWAIAMMSVLIML